MDLPPDPLNDHLQHLLDQSVKQSAACNWREALLDAIEAEKLVSAGVRLASDMHHDVLHAGKEQQHGKLDDCAGVFNTCTP